MLLILFAHYANAQTYTLNWGSSFTSSWTAGHTSGSANNIGGSSVNATVSVTNSESSAFSIFSSFISPLISSAGNPFTTKLGSNVSNLALGVDWSSNTKYIDVVISFNTAVKNVSFNIADIDKYDNWFNNNYYQDEVVVTGANGGLPVTNPTITKLVSTSNFVTIAGNIASANKNFGQGGNSASSSSDQDATVTVDFGSTMLTSVTIRYRNNSAAQSDPGPQAIAIGNISFQRAIALPVQLTSFNGFIKNNTVHLGWITAQEENLDRFIIEKSSDALSWQTLSSVKATGNTNAPVTYNTIDANMLAVNYYRLKQIDVDGGYTYSQIIRIRNESESDGGVKIYPNPVVNNAAISINSRTTQTVHIKIHSSGGQLVNELVTQLSPGSNNITITDAGTLIRGLYIVNVEDAEGKRINSSQFIKQ